MILSNNDILTRIDAALKGITDVTALGDSILQPTKFDRFIKAMQHKTVILPEARYIEMKAQKADVDRIAFSGRIMKSGTTAAGADRTLSTSEFSSPSTYTNQLIAKEMQAIVSIKDTAMRRNIEKENFEDTLIQLMGEHAGLDLEEWGLLTRLNYNTNNDLYLSLTNGWLELAENKVYGAGASKDFDPAAATYPENMFQAMLDALPKQYLGDLRNWRIYATFSIMDAYRDILKARGTALGDAAQTTGDELYWKGIKIKYCPMLERSKALNVDGAGTVCTLQNPDNMAWGVFHEVSIEREREAKERRTDFVLTVEADAHYEDENAAVVAYADAETGQIS